MAVEGRTKAGFGLPTAMRALRHRNFRLFIIGQLISLIGTWMQNVAQSWLIYAMTHDPQLLGLVGFCGQIPVLLLAPFGGTLADRRKRRTIVIITQTSALVLAFVLAGLTLAGVVKVWEIFIIAALGGIVNAFDIPARQSFFVEMVGKEDLTNAIALNSSMFNGARILGPAIAGIMVSAIGEGWCFLANGISYVAVIICLVMMRVEPRKIQPRKGSVLGQIAEGFRYVGSTRPILWLIMMIALAGVMGTPYSVLMPVFAKNILHGDAKTLGLLMGATGIGALSGALALATRQGIRGLGRWVALSSGGFGTALICFSLSHTLWISEAILVPVGFCMMLQMASTNTLIQSMVPDQLRGRVMSVYSMMFMGMTPFGSLLAGFAAGHIGAPRTVAMGGLICIVGASLFGYRLPAFREAARELVRAQDSASDRPVETAAAVAVAVEAAAE